MINLPLVNLLWISLTFSLQLTLCQPFSLTLTLSFKQMGTCGCWRVFGHQFYRSRFGEVSAAGRYESWDISSVLYLAMGLCCALWLILTVSCRRISSESPEIQPKFVKGSKRYGRRSTPEFIEPISDLSEVGTANPEEQEDLEDNYDSAVPRKREVKRLRASAVLNLQTQGCHPYRLLSWHALSFSAAAATDGRRGVYSRLISLVACRAEPDM